MGEFVITVDSESAPEILLGQSLFGGKVVAISMGKNKFLSVADLIEKYGLSRPTIISKLSLINEGTTGKHLYDAEKAHALLKDVKRGPGRGRKN